jgi:hypothetical protein
MTCVDTIGFVGRHRSEFAGFGLGESLKYCGFGGSVFEKPSFPLGDL